MDDIRNDNTPESHQMSHVTFRRPQCHVACQVSDDDDDRRGEYDDHGCKLSGHEIHRKKIANDAENVVGALQQAKRNELQDVRAPGRRSDKNESRRFTSTQGIEDKCIEGSRVRLSSIFDINKIERIVSNVYQRIKRTKVQIHSQPILHPDT